MNTRLGPFELVAPLGEGGMGEVWRAVHVPSGELVALKRVSRASGRRVFFSSLAAEVRAMASLNHPNVALVLDFGTDGDHAYLAMELLDGTIESWAGRLGWPDYKRLLLEVLAGLAHAHARGMVHRDIKPSNLLVRGASASTLTVKIADFGLAHLPDAASRPGLYEPAAGSPAFVAPEQREGRFREYGPWTDLYALGHTARRLGAGAFFPVDLEAWLARLHQPQPAHRFRCAADAAQALECLDDRVLVPLGRDDVRDRHTLVGDFAASPIPAPSRVRPVEPRRPPYRPEPSQPATDESARLSMQAGTGLFRLRCPAMVGRQVERAHLWAALGDVHASGRPRVVIIEGSAGVGKSRLARWIADQACEQGLAASFVTSHSPADPLGHALVSMLTARIGLHHLTGEMLLAHARERLPEAEADEVFRLLQPDAARTLAPSARHAAFCRILRALEDRPAVVVLDDAHWCVDSVAFARLVADADEWPALIVVVARTDLLPDQPVERAELDALRSCGAASTIALAPLAPDDHLEFLRRLLGFHDAVATRIAGVTNGNPLLAVELVADLIDRGALQAGRIGLELAPGVTVDGPAGIHHAYNQRIARATAEWSAPELTALELAAALGREVAAHEWTAACAELEVEPPWHRIDELLAAGIVRRDANRADFEHAHEMLRVAWLDRATARGAFERAHLACAAALGRMQRQAERVLTHRLAARDFATALPLFPVVARQLPLWGGSRDLLSQQWDHALEQAGEPEGTWTWVECKLHSVARLRRASPDEMEQLLRRLEAFASTGPVTGEQRARILRHRALTLNDAGQCAESIALFAESAALCRGDPGEAARAFRYLAAAYRQSGRFEDAIEAVLVSIAMARRTGEPNLIHDAMITLLQVHGSRGDHAAFEAAVASWDTERTIQLEATVATVRGDLARYRGDLDLAEQCYRASRDVHVRAGMLAGVYLCDLNLGQNLVTQGRFAECRDVLTRAHAGLSRCGFPQLASTAWFVMLPADAALLDRTAWHDHYTRGAASMRSAELDVALATTRATELALEAGWKAEARQACTVAIDQYTRLGRPVDAESIRARFKSLFDS